MKTEFLLYGYGGAFNHGGEAIARTCISELRKRYPGHRILLSTHFVDQDIIFGLNPDVFLPRDYRYVNKEKEEGLEDYIELLYKETISAISSNTVALSIGGDNYCYPQWKRWKYIHDKVEEKKAVDVLFSCSVGDEYFDDTMLKTLMSYQLITARESETFDYLISKGLKNVELCGDVAFMLAPENCYSSLEGKSSKYIGINISPLIERKTKRKGIVFDSVIRLISYVRDYTDFKILLIPHVVAPSDNDYEILSKVKRRFLRDNDVVLVSPDLSASQYKYLIAGCECCVCARTHVAIAAYSSDIPCLAVGYSIKATGIARDMEMDQYMIDVEDISDDDRILTLFEKLIQNKNEVKHTLHKKNKVMRLRSMRNFDLLDKYVE